ncbi:MAG TPA: hypothetical protein ENF52_04795, partial [Chloroflexi bacterium]|nr:hypothetical protein [Chloroflexota bacterium]
TGDSLKHVLPGAYTFPAGWSIIHLVAYHQHDSFHAGLATALAQAADCMSRVVAMEPQLAGDVDGDGRADVIDYEAEDGNWSVFRVDASGLGPKQGWLQGFNGGSPTVGDWNGDGLCDIALFEKGTWRFALSTGSQFDTGAISEVTTGEGVPATGDFNGDGITDVASFHWGRWQVALGQGSGFIRDASFDLDMQSDPMFGACAVELEDRETVEQVKNMVQDASQFVDVDQCYFSLCEVEDLMLGKAFADQQQRAYFQSLRDSLSSEATDLEWLIGEVDYIQYELEDIENEISDKEQDLEWLESEIQELEEQLDNEDLTDEERECLESELNEKQEEYDEVYSELQDLYEQRDELQSELDNRLQEMEELVSQMTSEAEELTMVVSDMVPEGETEHVTGDFNGDGLTDLGIVVSGAVHVALATGTGFAEETPWPVNLGDSDHSTADCNGDGRSDLIWFDKYNGAVHVAYSVSTGFLAGVCLPVSFTLRGAVTQLQVADWNGDGLPDFGAFDQISGAGELELSEGGIADLMEGASNGLGAGVSFEYSPSTVFSNSFLPFAVPVVTRLVTTDGVGATGQTEYVYSGGLYDAATREFRGFSQVEAIEGCGRVVRTEFLQESYNKGRPAVVTTADTQGNIWKKQIYTWAAETPYPGLDIYFTYLQQLDVLTYDGDDTFRQLRTRFQYDDYGNLLNTYAEGEVGVSGDESKTLRFYAYNQDKWIVDKPYLIQTLDSEDRIVAQVRYYYDGSSVLGDTPTRGNLTREEEWLDRPEERWIPTTLEYDEFGNVVSITDARGATVSNEYDVTGTFIVRTVNALGHRTHVQYDPRNGKVVMAEDQNGVRNLTEYDALGRIVQTAIVDPGTGETNITAEFSYRDDTVPLRTRVTVYAGAGRSDPLVVYRFQDGLGRLIQTRGPADDGAHQVVSDCVRYDGYGRTVAIWSPYEDDFSEEYVAPETVPETELPTQYTYDPLDRVTLVVLPDGSQVNQQYSDWLVTRRDANGNLVEVSYDARGKVAAVKELVEGGFYLTQYQYDCLGNLTSIVDHAGNRISMTYDSQNRRLSVCDPDMGTWSFRYDDVDNLVEQMDARGVRIHFSYDLLGRLTNKTYSIPNDTAVAAVESVNYYYDDPTVPFGTGRLCRVEDGSGVVTYSYDYMNRPIEEKHVIDGKTYRIRRTYDLLGRLRELQYPDGGVVRYQYGGQGSVAGVFFEFQGTTNNVAWDMAHDALGRVVEAFLGDGSHTYYTYDPATRRLAALDTLASGGSALQEFSYTYDAVGNLTRLDDQINGTSQVFAYDAVNRLIQA